MPSSPLLTYNEICALYPSSTELKALSGPWRSAIFIDLLPRAYAVVGYSPGFLGVLCKEAEPAQHASKIAAPLGSETDTQQCWENRKSFAIV